MGLTVLSTTSLLVLQLVLRHSTAVFVRITPSSDGTIVYDSVRNPGRPGEIKIPDEASALCSLSTFDCSEILKAPIRTPTGICNNPNHPFWGALGAPLERLAKAQYGPNNSPNDIGKPNVRTVSTSFHPDKNITSPRINLILMLFGQFVDHDLSLSPEVEAEHCCGDTGGVVGAFDGGNAECFPIKIPGTDEFHKLAGNPTWCLEFTRSEPFCGHEKYSGNVREQFNVITAYLDSSNVYGSSIGTQDRLRLFSNGLMKTNTRFKRELLPEINGVSTAGDSRADEMAGLASIHTLFLREHNRIANLIRATPHASYLDDEGIFQLARQINNAQYQNIIYNEYLPIVIGQNTLSRIYRGNKFRSVFNEHINPGILTEFSTAAYRFGHSLIKDFIPSSSVFDSRKLIRTRQLRSGFFSLADYFADNGLGADQIISGMLAFPIQEMDRFVTEEVTNFLFLVGNQDSSVVLKKFGGDLVARNLQRSRDHGLRGYTFYRKLCGLAAPRDFNDFEAVRNNIPLEHWNILKTLYKSPADIDLFTGGLAESPYSDSLSGWTFTCLKATQFRNLVFGDRFFFSHRNEANSMDDEQVSVIAGRSFADLICANTEISKVPPKVFQRTDPSQLVDCSSLNKENPLKIDVFLRDSNPVFKWAKSIYKSSTYSRKTYSYSG